MICKDGSCVYKIILFPLKAKKSGFPARVRVRTCAYPNTTQEEPTLLRKETNLQAEIGKTKTRVIYICQYWICLISQGNEILVPMWQHRSHQEEALKRHNDLQSRLLIFYVTLLLKTAVPSQRDWSMMKPLEQYVSRVFSAAISPC